MIGTLISMVFAFLEMTFVLVFLLILHGLKKQVGQISFYFCFGLLFVFMEMIGAAKLIAFSGYPGLNMYLATCIMLPFLAVYLVIYVTDGTITAQRMIIAQLAGLGLFLYLAHMTNMRVGGQVADRSSLYLLLTGIFNKSLRYMAADVLSFAVDIFLLPIIYQRLRNQNCRQFFCVAASLLTVQFLDSVMFSAIYHWGQPRWWAEVSYAYLSRMLFSLWLSAITGYYLYRFREEDSGEFRNSFDILFSFFGSGRRAKQLKHNLEESEARYRVLFRSAGELVLSMSADGMISDVNDAGLKIFGAVSKSGLPSMDFAKLSGVSQKAWTTLFLPDSPDSVQAEAQIPGTEKLVEYTFSPATMEDVPMVIVFGRDVTEERRLAQEREELQVQDFHRQRLESIGRLAGGIAHDFNNYLHAIQGHLDLIRFMYPVEDPKVNKHLDCVDSITGKASTLTKQLLGFARKGNYRASRLEVISHLKSTVDFFLPNTPDYTIDLFGGGKEQEPMFIEGDPIQLQQAILNILFNARDAMQDAGTENKTIHISLIRNFPEESFDPPADAIPEKRPYCAISIRDNGPGIPESVRPRIFEPFFTTKGVGKGTGMGLSMASGILLAHKGWIQLGPPDEKAGAEFLLVLPILGEEEDAETEQSVTTNHFHKEIQQ